MDKDIGQIYKHIQSKISTTSIKKPVLASSAYSTSSYIELTRTSVSYVIDKNKKIPFCDPKIPSRMI